MEKPTITVEQAFSFRKSQFIMGESFDPDVIHNLDEKKLSLAYAKSYDRMVCLEGSKMCIMFRFSDGSFIKHLVSDKIV